MRWQRKKFAATPDAEQEGESPSRCPAELMTDEDSTVEKSVTTPGRAKRDLTGQQFGRLTALRRVPAPDGVADNDYWLCRCACGKEKTVLAVNLLRGHTRSCGCMRQRDLTGQHINMLTVLERSDQFATRGQRKVRLWKCRCDCGNITYKATDTLTSQRQCSCAACAGKRNAAKARKNAGFVEGTQLSKIAMDGPSMPHDGKCRGVYYDKRSHLWEAVIKFRGKRTRLGYFREFEDAVKARQVAEDDVFGEFWRQLEARKAEEEAAAQAEAQSPEKQKADGGTNTAVCLAQE